MRLTRDAQWMCPRIDVARVGRMQPDGRARGAIASVRADRGGAAPRSTRGERRSDARGSEEKRTEEPRSKGAESQGGGAEGGERSGGASSARTGHRRWAKEHVVRTGPRRRRRASRSRGAIERNQVQPRRRGQKYPSRGACVAELKRDVRSDLQSDTCRPRPRQRAERLPPSDSLRAMRRHCPRPRQEPFASRPVARQPLREVADGP